MIDKQLMLKNINPTKQLGRTFFKNQFPSLWQIRQLTKWLTSRSSYAEAILKTRSRMIVANHSMGTVHPMTSFGAETSNSLRQVPDGDLSECVLPRTISGRTRTQTTFVLRQTTFISGERVRKHGLQSAVTQKFRKCTDGRTNLLIDRKSFI